MNAITHCPCGKIRKPTCILCRSCWDSAPLQDTRDFMRLKHGKQRWQVAMRLKDHARSRQQMNLIPDAAQ